MCSTIGAPWAIDCGSRWKCSLMQASMAPPDSSFFSRFTLEVLDLMDGGFATAEREVPRNRHHAMEIVRVRIIDEGRRAVGGQADLNRH
jgi:hypothetical protein